MTAYLKEDLDNLRHMTGSDSRYKQRDWGFRNHYCANNSGSDYESMVRLEKMGCVIRSREESDMVFFHATEAGCQLIGFNPKQIKKALGD